MVTEAEIDALMETYRKSYDIASDDLDAIRYQAREEIAMKRMMDREGCKASWRQPRLPPPSSSPLGVPEPFYPASARR